MNDAQIIAQAKEWWSQYRDQLTRMLGINMAAVVPTFRVGNLEGDTRASTDDHTVTLDRAWFRQHPDDVGAVIHEAVHAAQNVPDGSAGAKWVEAIADAARARLGLDDYGWEPSEEAERISRLKPWQMRAVAQSMAAGQFEPRAIKLLETGAITKQQVYPENTDTPYPDLMTPIREGGAGNSGEGGTGDIAFDPGDIGGGPGGDGEAKARRERQTKRNNRSYFVNTLMGYGFTMNSNLRDLVSLAVQRNWDAETFLNRLRDTPEYAREFAGIFNKDGSLKMTEAQYIAAKDQYTTYASRAGINMGPARMDWLFENNVTPEEFADRATAIGRLRRNKDLYQSFRKELVQAGIAKPNEVDTNKEMFKFVMGEGNQAWYDLWQDAVTRNAATQAGLTFAKGKQRLYTHLGQAVIERVSGMDLSEEALGAGFQQVEEVLRKVLPLSEAKLYGVSKKDAVQAAFGGKGRSKALGQIERATKTAEAFGDNQATQRLEEDQTGGTRAPASQRRAQSYS
jgi:hypothetical protein